MHLPPLETLSVSGISSFHWGTQRSGTGGGIAGSTARVALASEFPSRLFKASRFQQQDSDVDFDAHFLRWMLSDAPAGSCWPTGQGDGVSLKLKWIHQKSFSGDMPTCMQVGQSVGNTLRVIWTTDQPQAEGGCFRPPPEHPILPNLFDLGLHEYAELVRAGHLDPRKVTWFLCHYSWNASGP